MRPDQRFSYALVESIPERLEDSVVYVSRRYSTASHLCACGCGTEVVTALSRDAWTARIADAGISLWPSIGNWSFPCKSHYYIEDGRVRWSGAFSRAMVDRVRRADNPRAHAPNGGADVAPTKPRWWNRLAAGLRRLKL